MKGCRRGTKWILEIKTIITNSQKKKQTQSAFQNCLKFFRHRINTFPACSQNCGRFISFLLSSYATLQQTDTCTWRPLADPLPNPPPTSLGWQALPGQNLQTSRQRRERAKTISLLTAHGPISFSKGRRPTRFFFSE
ncbi:hypothetical protein AOLI_G00080780 [Acnodon oligacanthus]